MTTDHESMKRAYLTQCVATTLMLACTSVFADDRGKLVFADDFNRGESQEEKEEIGNDWRTNSDKYAGGNKRVDLRDGALHVAQHESAKAGTIIRRDADFHDATIEFRFQLPTADDSVGFSFANTDLDVHLGSLCSVSFRPEEVVVIDQLTGGMDPKIRSRRKAKTLTKEDKKLVASKRKSFPINIPIAQWHPVQLKLRGNTLTVNLNEKQVASMTSQGMGRTPKNQVRFSVSQSAIIDDFRLFVPTSAEPLAPRLAELIKTKGTLVYEDTFERVEADDSFEDLGPGWVTNSKGRAHGAKQADLKNGYLKIMRARDSNHGTSVRHDNPFDDGIVTARFRLHDEKGLGFHFNDPNCKVSHAGHICRVGVAPGKLDFRDGKMGQFNLDIRRKKEAGAREEELLKLHEGKKAFFDAPIETGKWHQIAFLIQGDHVMAWIDGTKVGTFTSPGIDHPVKFNIALSVWGEAADVDDLRIWSLKKD